MTWAPRTDSQEHKWLYSLPEWRSARARYLKTHRWCVWCSARGKQVRAGVVNHRTPVSELAKGQTRAALKRRFLDQRNWQPVCDDCHNSDCKRTDQGKQPRGCDANGVPFDLDPRQLAPDPGG